MIFIEVYRRVKMIRVREGKSKGGRERRCATEGRNTLYDPFFFFFTSASRQIECRGIAGHYSARRCLFPLNTQMKSSLILPCAALALPSTSPHLSLLQPAPPSPALCVCVCLSLSLSRDRRRARRAAEGAGEVIQSRISPSHPASWYSYHTVAPRGCLPAY